MEGNANTKSQKSAVSSTLKLPVQVSANTAEVTSSLEKSTTDSPAKDTRRRRSVSASYSERRSVSSVGGEADGSEPVGDWEQLVEDEVADWDRWTKASDWQHCQTKGGINLRKCVKAKDDLPAFQIRFKIRKEGPVIDAYKYAITSGHAERNDPNVKSSEVFKKSSSGRRKIKLMHIKFPWPIWDRVLVTASKSIEREGYFASVAISCENSQALKSWKQPNKTVIAFTRSCHQIKQIGEKEYEYNWICQWDAKGIIPQSAILYMTGILLDGANKSLKLIGRSELRGDGLKNFKKLVKEHGFNEQDHLKSPDCGGMFEFVTNWSRANSDSSHDVETKRETKE